VARKDENAPTLVKILQWKQELELTVMKNMCRTCAKKGKVFPYSLPSVGHGADPGVQAVSPQVT